MRVGVFGGTFDPPHCGHVAVATDVADALCLDEVRWIPSGEPPHKSLAGVSPADARLEMVRAAVAADPRFVTDTVELERPGRSFTVDTLRNLRARLPGAELFLILGADQFKEFGSWKSPEEIVSLSRLAVMDREGESARDIPLPSNPTAGVEYVPVRRMDISSTDVRARIRAGKPVQHLLPAEVARVVQRRGLYSAEPGASR